MLSLNAKGRDLVLPQGNVSDFFDSPWELLPVGRSEWDVGLGGVRGRKEKWE